MHKTLKKAKRESRLRMMNLNNKPADVKLVSDNENNWFFIIFDSFVEKFHALRQV